MTGYDTIPSPPDTLRATEPPEPTLRQILDRIEALAHVQSQILDEVLAVRETVRILPCRCQSAAE